MKHIKLYMALALVLCVSCTDLNIPPKNIVTDDALLSSQSGMSIYLSRMYSQMPFEDFKYIADRGFDGNSFLGGLGIEGTGEAVCRDAISISFTIEKASLWGRGYTLVHDANHLIKALPEYRSNYPELAYNEFLGQAYFVRAFVFTQMAKRFGGIPIVKEEISYPFTGEVEIARFSEKDTWDAILEDWDEAARLLPEVSTFDYSANRYAALAFKSDAMLYAGSVAKYNETISGRLTGFGKKTGVRVIGFAEDEWEDCSKKYFAEAYKAAKEIMNSGRYALYMKSWAEGDKEAQYKNMNDMWRDETSPENILVKKYEYPYMTHGLDAYSSPWIFRMPLSAGTCPTEDFMELFDGFDRYPEDGGIRVTDGKDHTSGYYLLFDKPMDFFKNVEPRLRAYVIFPGDIFRNREIEVRQGIYTGTLPIAPLRDSYDYSQKGRSYQHLSMYTDKNNKTLFLSPNVDTEEVKYIDKDGNEVTCYAAGENGPFFTNSESTMTGLYLRKYLDPDRELKDIGEGKSDQPFILSRYGEVLLNAAEAAVELAMAGAPSPVDDDMLQVATEAIQSIQRRAGANIIEEKLSGDIDSRNIVRKERRKELAFEHKTKWDLRRWRVLDENNRSGFWGIPTDPNKNGNGMDFAFSGLFPFYSTQANKWFFDIGFEFRKTYAYSPLSYYFAIPSGEVSKSMYIDQQPNR